MAVGGAAYGDTSPSLRHAEAVGPPLRYRPVPVPGWVYEHDERGVQYHRTVRSDRRSVLSSDLRSWRPEGVPVGPALGGVRPGVAPSLRRSDTPLAVRT